MVVTRGMSTVSSTSGQTQESRMTAASERSVTSMMRSASVATVKTGIARMVHKDQIMEEADRAVRKGLDSRVTSMVGDRSILAAHEESHPMTGEEILAQTTSGAGLSNLVKFTAATVNRSVRTHGIDKHMLLKVVLEDEWQYRTCTALPLTVIFFILFVIWVQMHYSTSYINLQESSLRHAVTSYAIGKDWQYSDGNGDVTDTKGMFDWLSNTYFPYIWSCANMPGVTNTSLGAARFQSVVAGVLIHTARGTMANCTDNVAQGQPCYNDWTREYDGDAVFNGWQDTSRRLQEEDFVPEGAGDAHDNWGMHTARKLNQVGSEIFMMMPEPLSSKTMYRYVIPISMSLTEVQALLAQWADPARPLISKSTTVFAVEAILRNERLGPGVVTDSRVSFLFSRGGKVQTQVLLQTNILKTGIGAIFVIAVWIFLLVCFTIFTPLRALAAAKHGMGCSHVLRPTNLFDWVLVIIGWVIVIFWLTERRSVMTHQDQWNKYQNARLTADPSTIVDFDRSWFNYMYTATALMGWMDGNLLSLVAFYHIVLLFRFLVASRGHPRLAIVVNTMNSGMIDLFHLFLVFGIIFAAYTVSGHILMGRRLSFFSTIPGSLGYNLSVIFMRQYNWGPISAKDWFTVGVWTWSFLLIEVQVIVNIVLAMIFDNYGDVRVHVTEKDTLWHTTRRLITQLRLMSSWVSNHDLLLALTKSSKNTVINADKLRQMLPGICNEQLSHLFDSAKLRLGTTVTRQNVNMIPEAVASILLAVDNMRQGVHLMAHPQLSTITEEDDHMFRVTQKPSEGLGLEEDEEAQGLEEFPAETLPAEQDGPGHYNIAHDNSTVRATADLTSPIVQHLAVGTNVRVLEVAVVGQGEDQRIRGRIESPEGWISLLASSNGYRFATKLPTPEDGPGKYIIVHNNAAVREDVDLQSTIVEHLLKGTTVKVVEIQEFGEDKQKRVRARIEQPEGWITLVDVSSDYRFAEKVEMVDKGPPMQAPKWLRGSLTEHIQRQQMLMDKMFWQMKHIEEELEKRGFTPPELAGRFPLPPLEEPKADPNHDPSFTGEITLGPGQGRHRLITHMPRMGQMPSSSGLANRLDRS